VGISVACLGAMRKRLDSAMLAAAKFRHWGRTS
jgi:hypothetical protein